ncbi:MAG: hypothetical protein DMF63_15635 [Acidobacteria bacterium]|nr:MAG: hypothetical protein DMF63_15635 [Acidobacteriota bacterium]
MQKSNVRVLFSRFMVLYLFVSLMGFKTASAFSLPTRSVAAAEITVTGQADAGEKPYVVVNGEPAFTGRTFFSEGTVATTGKSSATISLGKLGRIELAPESSLNLSFSEGRISGVLSKGQVNVSSSDGVSVMINTPTDSLKTEGNSPSRFTVAVQGDKTALAVQKGAVSNNSGVIKKDDDDDDDDDDNWKVWAWVGVIAGAATAIILIVTLNDDDDVVSPVR